MRRLIGFIVGAVYVCIGIRAWKVHKCRTVGTVLSICGHDPNPHVLDSLLQWLSKKRFVFVDPNEIVAMKEGHQPIRGSIVWLSFDDGWKDFSVKILPILERYNAKATIFVPPHETEKGYLWTNAINKSEDRKKIIELYGKPFKEREKEVKILPHNNVTIRTLMPKDEIIALSKHPLITIENHTWSHLSCFHRPVDEVVDEAKKAQDILESWTGRLPKFLCYPFGHYGKRCDEALKKIGLIGVHSDNGIGTISEIGKYRNMFRDNMSNLETIGRALDAWPNQHIPNAQ